MQWPMPASSDNLVLQMDNHENPPLCLQSESLSGQWLYRNSCLNRPSFGDKSSFEAFAQQVVANGDILFVQLTNEMASRSCP